ncbi:MAG: sigma-70 family RNA polymerase sigma factor [Anaerolineales bacterium]|nr:sigma-70 family RNA polymerase sigma factor [Anaerolineales bacterium]
MLDYGTIACRFQTDYAAQKRDRISGTKPALPITLRAQTSRRQAKAPLTHKASTLKDLRALDPQVLTEIHEAYFPAIFRYARYRLRNETLAEDIASETFLRLVEAVDSNRGPSNSIRGWLFGTASNLINDYFRRQYREEESLREDFSHLKHGESTRSLAQFEQQDYLRDAFDQLTEDQQRVIALRFGSGMSIEETASILRKGTNAVKALQYRAIHSLRKVLEVKE